MHFHAGDIRTPERRARERTGGLQRKAATRPGAMHPVADLDGARAHSRVQSRATHEHAVFACVEGVQPLGVPEKVCRVFRDTLLNGLERGRFIVCPRYPRPQVVDVVIDRGLEHRGIRWLPWAQSELRGGDTLCEARRQRSLTLDGRVAKSSVRPSVRMTASNASGGRISRRVA